MGTVYRSKSGRRMLRRSLFCLLTLPRSPLVCDAMSQNAAVDYWEHSASPAFAHIAYKDHLNSEQAMVQRWNKQWLQRWAGSGWLKAKRVGDYGIGAGLLAKVLATNHSIAHYVGFDIATRSLSAASKKLQGETSCPHTLILVSGPTDFASQHLDVLICQQVIQHFPSRAYTLTWLAAIESARIPKVLLEVRTPDGRSRPVFNEWHSSKAGLTTDDVSFAVAVSCSWIAKQLPSYTLEGSWPTASGRSPASKVLKAWTFHACAFSIRRTLS